MSTAAGAGGIFAASAAAAGGAAAEARAGHRGNSDETAAAARGAASTAAHAARTTPTRCRSHRARTGACRGSSRALPPDPPPSFQLASSKYTVFTHVNSKFEVHRVHKFEVHRVHKFEVHRVHTR